MRSARSGRSTRSTTSQVSAEKGLPQAGHGASAFSEYDRGTEYLRIVGELTAAQLRLVVRV